MDYILTIPTEMGGNYGLFGYFHSVMVLDTFYPMLTVYDQNGWHIGKPDPTGDLSFTDASYYSISVDYPADMVIVASGIKIDGSQNGERETAQFAIGPARDFYLALSEDYIKLSEQVGEVMINSYALPSDKDGANIALDAAVHALNSFSSRFGDYPYKELDVISSPMQAMGIESPGIIGIGIDLYKHDEKTDTTMNPEILESVVVHEVGHQWFYNLVGNDQVGEPWLDESITQYATSLYYIDRYPGDAVEQYRKSWQGRWDRIQQEKIPIGLPVSAYDGKSYSPIIYGRGPYFLLELEKMLGSELNAQFWKEYVARYQWQISTTGEFRNLAEEICDCQLGDLFIDWVYEVD
jgi:aminopeptidase N